MQWVAKFAKAAAPKTPKKRLWKTADQFHTNSGLNSLEYSAPLLGVRLLTGRVRAP